ncbi:MAG: ribonuclease HII [Betaproteobacteria bacterium]|nr:ribonuclease HII [Betaproteobacteria bacterium]
MKGAPYLICGVDEAGRGPLAGPVCAAAVILDPDKPIGGLKDSKKLSAGNRLRLADEIRAKAIAWAVAWATVEEIDRINILQASLLAMRRSVMDLAVAPNEVWVDGNRCPELPYPSRAIIKGDELEPAISAASILAKTARDKTMVELARYYPEYGFDRHSGYPTADHIEALRLHGVTSVHRRTFGPVRRILDEQHTG